MQWLAVMLAVLAMAGCATLHPDFERRTVTMNSIWPLSYLVNQRRNAITYDLDTKLDLGGTFPALPINESREINLAVQLP